MNGYSEKMASSLALVEKRNQRPGGCVGIFSQLFDWNKRLAKKKLFSKKQLPPVPLKKASKIFGRDEKQPKLRLIADENCGGFPCMKNNGGSGHINTEGKNETQIPGLVARLMGLESMPTIHRDKLEKTRERGEFCVQKAETKNESRPQKLQKTGLNDRKPVSKLEAEAFQLKNVLSRSKKRHHKVVSPVKSPGNLSGKVRLVGAATRILEPGLQRNRSNSVISYSNGGQNPTTKGFTVGASESSNRLDAKDFKPNPDGKQQVLLSINIDHSHEFFQSGSGNTGVPVSFSVEEKQRNQCKAEFIIKETCCDREDQRQRRPISMEDNIWKDRSSFGLKGNIHGERQMFKGRKNLPSRSKLSKIHSSRVPSPSTATNDTGSSIALDRYCDLDVKHNIHPSVSHVRKRRSDNNSGKMESPVFVDSRPAHAARSTVMSRRDTSDTCRNLVHPQESENHLTGIHSEVDENVRKETYSRDLSSHRPALHEDSKVENKHEYFPLVGDNLGAFLQEKLRELTSHQEENESANGHTSPRKTVAVILQELISALTRGRPCHQDHLAGELQKKPSYFHNSVQSKVTSSTVCQECEHFSPASGVEGAFSDDSFVTSSLVDDSSKYREETVLSEHDADLSVSASSSSMGMLFRESITLLTRHITEALSSIVFADILSKGTKLVHAKEVILNTEMVFGNASTATGIYSNQVFSICNFVQNELETIVGLMWARFRGLMGSNNSKLKSFVFDCMIEYLESRFSRYSNTGFNAWTRLPLRMKTEMLTCEIVEEVGRWIYMSGLRRDELIEYEMSHKLGKWLDFDVEAFEIGVEIDLLILDDLVDEIVIDVC